MSVDGCCRWKACLCEDIYILFHVPPQGNTLPDKVNDSMMIRSRMNPGVSMSQQKSKC